MSHKSLSITVDPSTVSVLEGSNPNFHQLRQINPSLEPHYETEQNLRPLNHFIGGAYTFDPHGNHTGPNSDLESMLLLLPEEMTPRQTNTDGETSRTLLSYLQDCKTGSGVYRVKGACVDRLGEPNTRGAGVQETTFPSARVTWDFKLDRTEASSAPTSSGKGSGFSKLLHKVRHGK